MNGESVSANATQTKGQPIPAAPPLPAESAADVPHESNRASGVRASRSARLTIGLLIALHFTLGLHTALSKTVTHDELWHLPVGLRNLQDGRFDFDVLNPPLTRMWAALPLYIAGVETDATASGPQGWTLFIAEHAKNFHRWYVWGRVFNLALSVFTVILLARWAQQLFGDGGALLVTLLYCTCPNVLAHASLVTPDAGLMFGFVAILYAFWIWTQRRTWSFTIVFGVLLGLAQAAKFTAVLLYPVLVLLWFAFAGVKMGKRSAAAGREARGRFWQLPAAFVVSLLVLNAVYQFGGSFRPLDSYAFSSSAMQLIAAVLESVSWIPLPFPEDYLVGIDAQRKIMESNHPVFLDGVWSVTGFPDYYPRTLLYKLPHPLHACVLIGLILSIVRPGRGGMSWRLLVLLTLPVVALLGVATTTSMQLGVRYVLPVLPLMMLIAARAGLAWNGWSRPMRCVSGMIIVLACLSSLRHHPHHLAYFNEYGGGPVGGRDHLLDSNIDWGQDLHLVKEFMDERGLQSIGLAYFGTLPPERLGIRYTIPPDLTRKTAPTWSLPPGWYAVSVNFVVGRPHPIRHPDGSAPSADIYAFAYFRKLTPVARLGYSIDVYHVSPEQAQALREGEDASLMRR